MTPAGTKKRWERRWAEEASRLLSKNWVFSDDREEPDFLVTEGHESFGLEITLAFEDLTTSGQSKQRQREAFNAKRLHNLYRTWSNQSDTILDVKVLGHLVDSTQHEVIQALTDNGMADRSVADPPLRIETPSGTRVFARVAFHPRWSQVDDSVGWVTQDAVAQAQAAIARKSSRLPSYRAAVGDDIRLLIVADHSRSSGMLQLESVDAINPDGFSVVYFLTFPGGPVREILAKPPSA